MTSFCRLFSVSFIFCNYPGTTEIYTSRQTLSLHDALPIYAGLLRATKGRAQSTQEPAVHPGDTDIDIGGDAVRPRKVARPDRGRQTILGVVGEADGFCLRIEGSDVAARSENLLADHGDRKSVV